MNKFSFKTAIFSIVLLGVSACSTTSKMGSKTTNKTLQVPKAKVQQLATKMQQAEFTLMALNDQEFIKGVLSNNGEPSNAYVQCVFNSIKTDTYSSEIPEVAQYLANNYPDAIDDYLITLDFLIPIVRTIYSYPQPVSFNTQDLSRSSALAILPLNDAQTLATIISTEHYAPLLATIGLPAKKSDGTIEDISVMQINSLMEYIKDAKYSCQ